MITRHRAAAVVPDVVAHDLAARINAFAEPEPEPAPGTVTFALRDEITLSTREREVAVAIARGTSNREIAAALGISVKTVDTHRAHVLKKVGARNNADLTRYAIQTGTIGVYPEEDA